MRTSEVISITMPPAMARAAKRLAKQENRSVSELMREAFRKYQKPKRSLKEIIEHVRKIAPPTPEMEEMWRESKRNGTHKMSMKEINRIIDESRKERAKRAKSHVA
jgi:hypothetical protein